MRQGIVRRLRTLFDKLVVAVAVVYPASLVVIAALLGFVGDYWWVTSVGLFLPRVAFAVPLPVVVLLILVSGRRRLLWLQLGAVWLILFPLMGFVFPLPSWPRGDGPSIRVASCNVNSGHSGWEKFPPHLALFEPDVVLLQEIFMDPRDLVADLKKAYPHVEVSTQFLIASRYPIVEIHEPNSVRFHERERSPRFMRYVVEAPVGRVTIYNVHPISSRAGFYALRGAGLRKEILSGRLFTGAGKEPVIWPSQLREIQIRAVAESAAKDAGAVLIAGDLNLPGLSPVFRKYLSSYRDGFEEAGGGFGYTYPNHPRWPEWMRLDRILSNDALRFTHFEVRDNEISDHLCVGARLVRDD